jgi:hypothetical protein
MVGLVELVESCKRTRISQQILINFILFPSLYWEKLNRDRRLYCVLLYRYALQVYIRFCLFGVWVCLIFLVSLMMTKITTLIIIIISVIINL